MVSRKTVAPENTQEHRAVKRLFPFLGLVAILSASHAYPDGWSDGGGDWGDWVDVWLDEWSDPVSEFVSAAQSQDAPYSSSHLQQRALADRLENLAKSGPISAYAPDAHRLLLDGRSRTVYRTGAGFRLEVVCSYRCDDVEIKENGLRIKHVYQSGYWDSNDVIAEQIGQKAPGIYNYQVKHCYTESGGRRGSSRPSCDVSQLTVKVDPQPRAYVLDLREAIFAEPQANGDCPADTAPVGRAGDNVCAEVRAASAIDWTWPDLFPIPIGIGRDAGWRAALSNPFLLGVLLMIIPEEVADGTRPLVVYRVVADPEWQEIRSTGYAIGPSGYGSKCFRLSFEDAESTYNDFVQAGYDSVHFTNHIIAQVIGSDTWAVGDQGITDGKPQVCFDLYDGTGLALLNRDRELFPPSLAKTYPAVE